MPYTSCAKVSDEDVAAMYAYFMKGVEAVDTPTEPTRLPFPFNIRLSMAGCCSSTANRMPATRSRTTSGIAVPIWSTG